MEKNYKYRGKYPPKLVLKIELLRKIELEIIQLKAGSLASK
jgi:hypothetical protein